MSELFDLGSDEVTGKLIFGLVATRYDRPFTLDYGGAALDSRAQMTIAAEDLLQLGRRIGQIALTTLLPTRWLGIQRYAKPLGNPIPNLVCRSSPSKLRTSDRELGASWQGGKGLVGERHVLDHAPRCMAKANRRNQMA